MPPNIEQFLKDCANRIADKFYSDMDTDCLDSDYEMESPIEWILYIALNTIIRLHDLQFSDPIETPTGTYLEGFFISPQKQVDNYRVDFLISYDIPIWNGEEYHKKVIVECDSQEFHERSEKERRYEKARDRAIQGKGYKIFRYTGREIIDQPFVVASEILDEIVPWSHSTDNFLDDDLQKIKVKL